MVHIMQTLVDIDLFMDIHRIERALFRHSCTEAIAWCSENKTALRKIKVSHELRFPVPDTANSGILQSTLEFELRLQEYIELARARKKEEAIAYVTRYLVPWQETHLEQITQAMALLAFQPSTTCRQYRVRDPSKQFLPSLTML